MGRGEREAGKSGKSMEEWGGWEGRRRLGCRESADLGGSDDRVVSATTCPGSPTNFQQDPIDCGHQVFLFFYLFMMHDSGHAAILSPSSCTLVPCLYSLHSAFLHPSAVSTHRVFLCNSAVSTHCLPTPSAVSTHRVFLCNSAVSTHCLPAYP